MQAGFATLTVVGPDSTQYQSGQVSTNGGTVTVGVSPLGPAGRYEIGYRVISEDGHPVSGSVGVHPDRARTGRRPPRRPPQHRPPPPSQPDPGSRGPGAPAPTPATAAASTPDSGDMPVWPWIVGGVVLIGIAAVAALRLGRS